jgi:putative ABC transport system permease protein
VYRLTLVLRGLWWRRGLTAAVLVVGTITTAAAALGPLYARAAAESTLHDQLADAPVTQTGLHFKSSGDVSSNLTYQSVLQLAPKPGSIVGYPNRIVDIYAPTPITGPDGDVLSAALWRQGICQHVVIVSGTCPTKPGQVLVAQRTVAANIYGWRLGSTLSLAKLPVSSQNQQGFPVAVPAKATIVGTYRPMDTADPYWFGQDYFEAHPNAKGADTVDTVIVAPSEFTSLTPPVNAEVDVDFPLDVAAIHWNNAGTLVRQLDATQQRYTAQAQSSPIDTGIERVVAAARHQRSLVDTGTTLVTLQLGILAWLVLFQVISDAAEARGNEIALAKLRGRGPMPTLRFGLSEPLLLMLLAIPLGLLAALVVAHTFAASVLASNTPVVLPRSAVFAALIAFGGGLLAALVAAQRTLTRSALEQWQRTNSRAGRGWLSFAIDVVIAGLAIAGLATLHSNRHTGGSNSLLAPGLLVAAVALLGVRLLPLLCRALVPATRSRRRVGLFLAVRQVGRRPAGLRLAALLAIALGLASFAVAGESVAAPNRTARAQAEVGADRVVSIQYQPGHDPVAAVEAADPAGRWAMAAATWLPDGGDSVAGTMLGVDGSRLTAVGYHAAGGPTSAEIAATVSSAVVPTITVTAKQMRIHVTASDLSPGLTPDVQINLRTAHVPFLNVLAGSLRAGSNSYVGTLPCAGGCTFRGITWDRPFGADSNEHGRVVVTGIDVGDGTTWTPLSTHLTEPEAWRAAVPLGQASDQVQPVAGGVQDDYTNENGGYGGLTYAYAASPIPVVATHAAMVVGFGAPKIPQFVDDTQTIATLRVDAYASVLPVVLANGVIADVRYLEAELPAFAGEANWQVWLGPHAPADALARLRSAGLVVQNVKTEHHQAVLLGREGPALALLLLLGCAIAGTALAVGGTAISVSASSRRRSYELAALRAIGVTRGALLRAGVIEQGLLLGTAVVLGVPSGIIAARLAMPSIPEFAESSPVALSYAAQPKPVIAFICLFVLLLALTAVIAARALISVAVPGRLREGEE